MRYLKFPARVTLIAAFAVLAGCAGKIRYPSYYVLNPPAPAPAVIQTKPLLGSVAVREFSAPAFLRAGSIAYRPTANQIGFYPYDHWAVDIRHTVTDAVLQNMQTGGAFQSVYLFDGREKSDYLLTGTLEDLEEVDRGHDVFVEVRLSAQLTDLRSGNVLWRDTSSETAKVEQRGMPGIVDELSQSAETAVERLISSMQNRIGMVSASLAHRGAEPH